jgi:hypothetical protein
MMRTRIGVLAVLLALTSIGARADTITFSGNFDDAANAALRWSDLGAPRFADDNEIANNVALYDLAIPFAGAVGFKSTGYGAGGAEPYFTLFSGSMASMAAATFVTSNYFDSSIDFDISAPLAAGNYVVALGVWMNMSFAENSGGGTLADEFIFLGDPSRLGNYHYAVEITRPEGGTPPVPEPSTMLLLGAGVAVLAGFRRRSNRS